MKQEDLGNLRHVYNWREREEIKKKNHWTLVVSRCEAEGGESE